MINAPLPSGTPVRLNLLPFPLTPQTFASKPSVLKAENPVEEEVESLANSCKSLKFSTSQSEVREDRMLLNPAASTAVELPVDLREWKAQVVEQVISESVFHLAPGLLLLEEVAVAALVLDQEAEQEEAWLVPPVKPGRDLAAWGDLSPQEVWVGQQMVKVHQALKVIGESEVLEDMVPCTAVVEAAAVTTVAVAVELMLTHAAPTLAAVAVDLHTPTQV
jgi:hypothetical protein